MTKAIILCGGYGLRLRELTQEVPKVLVEVGSRPIVWHIMKSYAAQGISDFVLALGHRGDEVADRVRQCAEADWSVTYVDTGVSTGTSGRLAAIRGHVDEIEPFFVTYGDGLADIDLGSLHQHHLSHGRIGTLTVVHPRSQFGIVALDADGAVVRFREKPRIQEWVNGGFFVFDARVFPYLESGDALEKEPLEALSRDRELMSYQHPGYWACMDTYKDYKELNDAWRSGEAPWCIWDERHG